jgi:hypothetical protein
MLGYSVSSAGDVNGDGLADIVVGARNYSRSYGAAYVIFGKRGGISPNMNVSGLNGINGFEIDGAGTVSGAGDVNGDGLMT